MQLAVDRKRMCGHDNNGKGVKNPFHSSLQFMTAFYPQAVFEVDKENGLTLLEIGEDVAIEEIITSTGCEFEVSPNLKKMGQIDV